MGWGTARVLRDRNARLYLGGVIVSGFGNSAMALAAGIWVKTLTGSNALAAFVGFCIWFPVWAGPLLGVVADRIPRRLLLVVTNLVLAAALTAPLAVRSEGRVWVLFAVLTLVGIGTVLTDAAEVALVAAAVPAELRGDFNGLVRTALESMKLLAPLAGAGLFTVLGGPAVALLDAVTFGLAAGAFGLLRLRERASGDRPGGLPGAAGPGPGPGSAGSPGPESSMPGSSGPDRSMPGSSGPGSSGPGNARRAAVRWAWAADTAAGARYVWRHRTLRPLVLAGGTAMVCSSLGSTATYAMLESGLHRSPAFAGVLTPVQGLGSVIGGLAAGALLRRMPERVFCAAGLAVYALGALAWATPWLPAVLAGSLAVGLGLPCPLIAALTAVQRETPDALLGRAAATANTLVFAPTGLALLLGTATVATLDYRVQVVGAAALALAAAAALTAQARTTGRLPASLRASRGSRR